MNQNKEGGAPSQSSATNQQVNNLNQLNQAPLPVKEKRTPKKGKKSRTVVLTQGLSSVRIEHEKPRDGRKAWRVTWMEGGKEYTEMCATYDEAHTAATVKLNRLADGQRTFTRQEVKDLFAFKLLVEQFNQRLAACNRTLEQVVSDAIAAAETLPGWTMSQMAGFILENHQVKNPMLTQDVVSAFLKFLESGYKKKYSNTYLAYAEVAFRRFEAAFRNRYFHLIDEKESLEFISNYRVKAKSRQNNEVDKDGLMAASAKTKNTVYNLLNLLFEHAKNVLGALPRRLETAIAMFPAPGYEIPTPEIYTYDEIVRLYSLMPDLECVLFISLQLYAGLRPCECVRMHKKDIKRDASGKLSFIFVRQEVGKKSPRTGRCKIRTRKAPITPPLAAVLNSMELSETGRIFPSEKIDSRVRLAAHVGKFPWKFDALRHSFISYRLAVIKDREEVALEAGHGVGVQIEHYEGLIENHLDVAKFWAFVIPTDLPETLNFKIVGMKYLRAYKKAKAQAHNVVPMPKVA